MKGMDLNEGEWQDGNAPKMISQTMQQMNPLWMRKWTDRTKQTTVWSMHLDELNENMKSENHEIMEIGPKENSAEKDQKWHYLGQNEASEKEWKHLN